jgi:hypothetical protein
MSTAKTTPEPLTVAEAAKSAEDASRRLDELTTAVTSGDSTVTLEELNDARAQAEFTELQLRGAKTRERRQAEEQLRADVEKFAASYPKRLVEPFRDVAGYRKEALDALGAFLEAVEAVERVRADLQLEWNSMRPADVPLDDDEDLPDWYVAANPRDDHSVPHLDSFKAALTLATEALQSRHTGTWRRDRAELLRIIRGFIGDHQSSYEHAQQRANRKD